MITTNLKNTIIEILSNDRQIKEEFATWSDSKITIHHKANKMINDATDGVHLSTHKNGLITANPHLSGIETHHGKGMNTRLDGIKSKEENLITGKSKEHIDRVWDHLKKHGKPAPSVSGEFGSSPQRETIHHDGVEYKRNGDKSISYSSTKRTSAVWREK